MHANARLTPILRAEMVAHLTSHHLSQRAVAAAYHVSEKTLRRWLQRARDAALPSQLHYHSSFHLHPANQIQIEATSWRCFSAFLRRSSFGQSLPGPLPDPARHGLTAPTFVNRLWSSPMNAIIPANSHLDIKKLAASAPRVGLPRCNVRNQARGRNLPVAVDVIHPCLRLPRPRRKGPTSSSQAASIYRRTAHHSTRPHRSRIFLPLQDFAAPFATRHKHTFKTTRPKPTTAERFIQTITREGLRSSYKSTIIAQHIFPLLFL